MYYYTIATTLVYALPINSPSVDWPMLKDIVVQEAIRQGMKVQIPRKQ